MGITLTAVFKDGKKCRVKCANQQQTTKRMLLLTEQKCTPVNTTPQVLAQSKDAA